MLRPAVLVLIGFAAGALLISMISTVENHTGEVVKEVVVERDPSLTCPKCHSCPPCPGSSGSSKHHHQQQHEDKKDRPTDAEDIHHIHGTLPASWVADEDKQLDDGTHPSQKFDPANDMITRVMHELTTPYEHIIEFNGGMGSRVQHLCTTFKCSLAVNVDPSAKALAASHSLHADVKTLQGTVDDMDPEFEQWKGTFDAVVLHNVLDTIPRDRLFRALSNIWDLLKPNGRVVMYQRAPFLHCWGKSVVAGAEQSVIDYPEMFIATGMYHMLVDQIIQPATGQIYMEGITKPNNNLGRLAIIQKGAEHLRSEPWKHYG